MPARPPQDTATTRREHKRTHITGGTRQTNPKKNRGSQVGHSLLNARLPTTTHHLHPHTHPHTHTRQAAKAKSCTGPATVNSEGRVALEEQWQQWGGGAGGSSSAASSS